MSAPKANSSHRLRAWLTRSAGLAVVLGPLMLAALVLAVLVLGPRSVAAEPLSLPPWNGLSALPSWANSVHILKGDQQIHALPNAGSARRGSAAREMHLPLFGARPGAGCRGPWLHVGPQAWICHDHVELSGRLPIRHDHSLLARRGDGLPFAYYFAGRDGSLAYTRVEEVDIGEPHMSLEPGFAVAIVEERQLGRARYGRTNRGLWVPMRDLGAARPFAFHGEEITAVPAGKELPFGWVLARRARLYRKHGSSFLASGQSRARFDKVGVLEHAERFGTRYARVDEQHWIRAKDIRQPTLAAPPEEVAAAAGERWIDIELASQTLVAYEGLRPVFATLVSTGKGKRRGHPHETPKGVHRIWVKLLTSVMDNLEDEGANRYYRIEDVPYVQYFAKGVGLHAAFWHRSFGKVRSHGCVNLAPLDARRLFGWTHPRIPAGWTAALPTQYDRGTAIRVR